MSGDESYKPSAREIEGAMDKHADWDQANASLEREARQGMPYSTQVYSGKIETALSSYTDILRNNVENAKEGEHPDEWKKDAEKAREIVADIRKKLLELQGLFKID